MIRPRELRPDEILILLGAHNVADTDGDGFWVVGLSSIHRHPRFQYATINNDIALLKLEKSVEFGPRVKPACLPDRGEC